MPMMNEEKLRRLIDTLTYAADFSPCDCHLRGPRHEMTCTLGAAAMRQTLDALRLVLGEGYKPNGAVWLMMEDEKTQREVSEWIARGRQ